MKTVTKEYLDGIKDGRAFLNAFPECCAADCLRNTTDTARLFDAQNPVGQFLRGERDFWKLQVKNRSE